MVVGGWTVWPWWEFFRLAGDLDRCTCSTHRCGGLRHSEPAGRENHWFYERSESEGTNLCLKWRNETNTLEYLAKLMRLNNKEIPAQSGPDWGGGLTVRPAQSGSSLTGLKYRWDEGELQSTVQIVAWAQLRRRKEREFNSATSLQWTVEIQQMKSSFLSTFSYDHQCFFQIQNSLNLWIWKVCNLNDSNKILCFKSCDLRNYCAKLCTLQ